MSRRDCLADWRKAAPAVFPSLLLCDFGNLALEVERLEAAGVPALHLDVMDGHFVPNLSYGLTIVEAVRKLTDLPLDVHLMISNPGGYLSAYRDAGANSLTVHREAARDENEAAGWLREIRRLGMGAGIAINPPTPLDAVSGCRESADLVLVMSVMPGFGGQRFDVVVLEKLARLRAETGADVLLEVDGGVNESTIADCGEAGAQLFVVGSAIFTQPDYATATADLTRLAGSRFVSQH